MIKNNNKGFTLIELLAVIVVLAIVTVIATQSVLPFMANAGRDAFASEANLAIDGAEKAMSLIQMGSIADTAYTKVSDTVYCFTIANLKTLGLFQKDDTSYAGTVTVTKSGNSYSYATEMHNDKYYVDTESGTIVTDTKSSTVTNGVGEVTNALKNSLKTTCTTS